MPYRCNVYKKRKDCRFYNPDNKNCERKLPSKEQAFKDEADPNEIFVVSCGYSESKENP